MAYSYSVFGLRLWSNRQIPGFHYLPAEPPFDVIVSLGNFPEHLNRAVPPDQDAIYVSPDLGKNGEPSSRVWQIHGGEYFRILYDEGTDCVIDRKGTRIWIWWPEAYTLADVVPYLQGQLFGLVQKLRGVTCLHACAILVGERAVVVSGPHGAGKSSTAAVFHQLGFPVIADDVVPIFEDAGKFMVRPAHSRVWLCPDMVETLYGSSDALPQFAPSWEKRYIELNAAAPGQPREPKRLGAIYFLDHRADEPERPLVTHARPQEAMLELLCNTYVNHLLDPAMRAREFAFLGRLHQNVPLRVVRPHADASKIAQLCQVILHDFAGSLGLARRRVPLAGGVGISA